MFSKWMVLCICATITKAQYGGGQEGRYNPYGQPILSDDLVIGDEIPGVEGVDYPVFDKAPDTGFTCDAQAVPGYYADPQAGCQVFYICGDSGRGTPFLCPNGTVFNQQFLVCDWWYNFDCALAVGYYGVNAEVVSAMAAVDAVNGVINPVALRAVSKVLPDAILRQKALLPVSALARQRLLASKGAVAAGLSSLPAGQLPIYSPAANLRSPTNPFIPRVGSTYNGYNALNSAFTRGSSGSFGTPLVRGFSGVSGNPLARASSGIFGNPLTRASSGILGNPLTRASSGILGTPLVRGSLGISGTPLARGYSGTTSTPFSRGPSGNFGAYNTPYGSNTPGYGLNYPYSTNSILRNGFNSPGAKYNSLQRGLNKPIGTSGNTQDGFNRPSGTSGNIEDGFNSPAVDVGYPQSTTGQKFIGLTPSRGSYNGDSLSPGSPSSPGRSYNTGSGATSEGYNYDVPNVRFDVSKVDRSYLPPNKK